VRAESQFRAPRLKGCVCLGSSDDVALGPLPTVLATFRNAHPDVELEITIGTTTICAARGSVHERTGAPLSG
jgi:DNA-binding transcriptional LysR family regulator